MIRPAEGSDDGVPDPLRPPAKIEDVLDGGRGPAILGRVRIRPERAAKTLEGARDRVAGFSFIVYRPSRHSAPLRRWRVFLLAAGHDLQRTGRGGPLQPPGPVRR